MFRSMIILIVLTSCTNNSEKIKIIKPISKIMEYTNREINLPNTKNPIVCKTVEINDANWIKLKEKISDTYLLGFKAYVDFSENDDFIGIVPENFSNYKKDKYLHNFIFLVDSLTISNSEHPILCVDLSDQPGKYFRVIPSEMWAVENNLTISNSDFDEFYESCGSDGIYRGD